MKTDKRRLTTVFLSCSVGSAAGLAVYLCYSSTGSGQILHPNILTACAVLVYNQILQGGFSKMRKVGIGHVYDIMESVADAGERLETVMRVETAAGGMSPESAELLRSAYDSMLSAVGDLAKSATR
uniref:Uncharacterized protein n=1 Tax=virus sp. ctFlR8 TaxID=2825811 RepID=A0A8S5RMX7_9VIRU|nr:MAG TPA: hypothetical protein [virus sp. ctFlR8]